MQVSVKIYVTHHIWSQAWFCSVSFSLKVLKLVGTLGFQQSFIFGPEHWVYTIYILTPIGTS